MAVVTKGGEALQASQVFDGLAEEGGEGAGEGVVAFFGEADAVAFGEVLDADGDFRHGDYGTLIFWILFGR